MRRLTTLTVLALLIGLMVYQASAATERSAPATLPQGGAERGAAAFPTGTWNTGIQVQNPTTSTATVQVKFYKEDGSLAFTTSSTTILAGGSATFYLPTIDGLADGKYSGVVESDQAVVAVVNETSYTAKGIADAYNGIDSGATQLNLPLIFRGYGNWDSMIAVQNTDASASASVALNFYKSGETSATLRKTDTIPALASKTYDVSTAAFDGLSSPFLGSLTITSTTNVAAVAHSARQTAGYDVLSIYRGFSSGATKYLAPLIFNQYSPSSTSGWVSGIQVQNLATTADTVTVTMTLTGNTYTKAKAIGASSSVTFYLPEFTDIPAGTYGSATIQSGGNQIVAIVNTTKYLTGVANAYNAVPDGSGTTRVVAPLAYNQYSPSNTTGWVTGIQAMNLGSATDTVTMTFKPTNGTGTYVKSASVAVGASTTFYLPSYTDIPTGLYGSAEVTSGSQKIIAVVNTTKYASSVATTYLGVNK